MGKTVLLEEKSVVAGATVAVVLTVVTAADTTSVVAADVVFSPEIGADAKLTGAVELN